MRARCCERVSGSRESRSTGCGPVVAEAHATESGAELVDIQGEPLLGVAVRVVAIAEADMLSVEGEDPGVADGDAVSVVGQIRENLLRSAKGWLAVHDPVGRGCPCKEQVEGDRVGKHSFGELERCLTPCLP